MSETDLSPEERMQLYDLIQGDAWKVVKRISDSHYRKCVDSLLAMSQSGDFRFTQGIAHGWKYLIDAIEQSAKPPIPIYDSGVSEADLNARKAKI